MSQLSEIDAFMAEEVKRWTEFLAPQVQQALTRAGHVFTGDLVQNVVARELGASNGKDIAELMFPTQGRMVDMGAGLGYRLGTYIGTRPNVPHPGHHGSKAYSRTAYGTLNTLISNLSNKFIAHTADGLKATLTDGRTG